MEHKNKNEAANLVAVRAILAGLNIATSSRRDPTAGETAQLLSYGVRGVSVDLSGGTVEIAWARQP